MVKRENLIDQKSPPRFLIRACSVLVELETAQSRMIPIFEQAWRRKDYASLIPSNCKFCVPPGGGTIHNFQQKNFARHRVFWRRPAYQGVEWASRGLQKSPGYTHENGAKPIDLNRLWIMDSERVLLGEMAPFLSVLFCLPSECFDRFELCQDVCDPAILFLLGLEHSLCGSTLHVQKLCIPF